VALLRKVNVARLLYILALKELSWRVGLSMAETEKAEFRGSRKAVSRSFGEMMMVAAFGSVIPAAILGAAVGTILGNLSPYSAVGDGAAVAVAVFPPGAALIVVLREQTRNRERTRRFSRSSAMKTRQPYAIQALKDKNAFAPESFLALVLAILLGVATAIVDG